MRRILLAAILLIPVLSWASAADPTTQTYNWVTVATTGITGTLQTIGFRLFYTLTVLQLIITMYGQMATGDVETAIPKLAKLALWTLFCIWLMMNNTAYNFIANTIQYFLNNAISWTTSSQTDFSVNGIIAGGLDALNNTIRAITKSAIPTSTLGWLAVMAGGGQGALITIIFGALMIGIIVIIVLLTCGYIALKVFMVKIEAGLILAVLPLSLAFLGLNALREQGFAPFKSMLALIYRIVILGIVVGGMVNVGATLQSYADGSGDPNIVQVCMVAVFSFVLLAFIAHKSDQIAATLASGSANIGSGDAVGAGIAGAAAGAAVVAAMGAAATAGSGAAKSMSEVMSGLSGTGEIKNAGTRGSGNTPEPAPSKASASIPSSTPAGGGSTFQTSSSGAPRKTATDTGSGKQNAGTSSGSGGGNTSQTQTAPAPSGTSTSNDSSKVNAGNSQNNSASSSAAPGAEKVDDSTPSTSSSGTGVNAGIEAAPQRNLQEELGRLADVLSAPKKETDGEKLKKHLGTVGQHVSNEKQATHVSVNTHHSE